MLANINRLKSSNEFEKVRNEGSLKQFTDFAVIIRMRGDEDPSRFGFVISTKISKDAVQRNRIKRALSEAIRHVVVETKAGMDIVFLAKPTIARKSTQEIMNATKEALARLGIIRS